MVIFSALKSRRLSLTWAKSYSPNRTVTSSGLKLGRNHNKRNTASNDFYALILINTVRSCENVLICDEHTTAILIRLVSKQSGHPWPLALIRRFTADYSSVLFHQFTTALANVDQLRLCLYRFFHVILPRRAGCVVVGGGLGFAVVATVGAGTTGAGTVGAGTTGAGGGGGGFGVTCPSGQHTPM